MRSSCREPPLLRSLLARSASTDGGPGSDSSFDCGSIDCGSSDGGPALRRSPRGRAVRSAGCAASAVAVAFAIAVAAPVGCGAGTPPAATGSELTQARPAAQAPAATVVLIHGMGGFKKLFGVDYYFGVPALYRAAGAKVVVPGSATLQTIEVRAAQLKAQLDLIDGPLVLVAHSQGGLDARYLIGKLGYAPRVKALVTIATPHHGSQLADLAVGLVPGEAEQVLDVLLGTLGWSIDEVNEMTTPAMVRFNEEVPDAEGVTYWSYSGRAAPLGLGHGDGWLQPELLPTWTALDVLGIPSDGIVPEASAHWGTFQGALPASHFGEVGQILGFTPRFAHAAFYAQLLQKLHDAGF